MRLQAVVCILMLAGGASAQRGPFRGPGLRLLDAQPGRPGQIVKGAPYSAEVSSETTQVLADGNKIRQTYSERLYRDSEGRTRREPSLSLLPGPDSAGCCPRVAFIDDPVASASYVLDLGRRSANRIPWQQRPPNAPGRGRANNPSDPNSKTESLGRQLIAGVSAEGTRITRTIPAGEIGNAQPIQIVTERWYSPELQAVILEKRTDPRFGESTYQWTNIVRVEPPSTLFAVPADFQTSQGPSPRLGRAPRP